MHLRTIFVFLFAITSLFYTSCSQTTKSLTIFSATSLTDAQEELASTFEEANPGITIKLNFASSSTLATQIIEGAKADIFASANILQMDRVAESGSLEDEARLFASNQVVLIVPKLNPNDIHSLDDLTKPNMRIVLALPGTPIRAYTDHLLNMATQDLGKGFFDSLLSNVRSEEATVRLVLSKVVLGEADAAFVYQSDLTPEVKNEILVIPTPERYQSEIAYPIAVLSASNQTQLAYSYIDFVLSSKGQSILAKWGFVPLSTIDS